MTSAPKLRHCVLQCVVECPLDHLEDLLQDFRQGASTICSARSCNNSHSQTGHPDGSHLRHNERPNMSKTERNTVLAVVKKGRGARPTCHKLQASTLTVTSLRHRTNMNEKEVEEPSWRTAEDGLSKSTLFAIVVVWPSVHVHGNLPSPTAHHLDGFFARTICDRRLLPHARA